MKPVKTFAFSLCVMISATLNAQQPITFEQFNEIRSTTELSQGSLAQFRKMAETLCEKYEVKNSQEKIDAYITGQLSKDVDECMYSIASQYLTSNDYEYLVRQKNNPEYQAAMSHNKAVKQMLIDSISVFRAAAKELTVNRDLPKTIEYQCPDSYKEKWFKMLEDRILANSMANLVKPLFRNIDVNLEEVVDPIMEVMTKKLCNWSYGILTEKDIDYVIEDSKSVANKHNKAYRLKMINKKEGIAPLITQKMKTYFEINE